LLKNPKYTFYTIKSSLKLAGIILDFEIIPEIKLFKEFDVAEYCVLFFLLYKAIS
jgi:hypothetical protein